jgi:hypothetical protein
MIAAIGAMVITTMAVNIDLVLKSESLDPALLETANTWFGRSWWGLMIAGGITALAACATVAFLIIQFWSSNIKERFSDEHIAMLNNDTARLTAENLALQAVLLPRHIELHGGKADGLFAAAMAEFKTVSFAIQPVNDAEARNLANEITLALAFVGIRAGIDEGATALNPNTVAEGVMVSFPKGDPLLEKAANSLADILTNAGLGVGNIPVWRYGIIPQDPKDIAAGLVNPIHLGVVVAVGQRPVSQTVAWLKANRPAAAGEPAASKIEKK